MRTINSFRGQYAFLSNFWMCPVKFGDLLFPSAEHAYQAAKSDSYVIRESFVHLATPADAKRKGRQVTLAPFWDQNWADSVMTTVVTDKFTRNQDLLAKLLATGDAELIEGNTWHDNYWGSCTCSRCGNRGKNTLGKILMSVRDTAKLLGVPNV